MTAPATLVKLSSEDIEVEGKVLGVVHRYGHPSSRGNSLYIAHRVGDEPTLLSSKQKAVAYIIGHAQPAEGGQPMVTQTERLVKGVLNQIYDPVTRTKKWAWRTHDGRLSGTGKTRAEVLEDLQIATGE